MEKIELTKTRKGLPAIWEKGGGYSNTGWAQIIAGPAGEKLKPLYVRRGGELANREHALFAAKVGMVVIWAGHHRGDYGVGVYKIQKILEQDGEIFAEATRIYHYTDGEWDQTPPPEFEPAIKAAVEKARCYHCRSSHYSEEWRPPLPR